MRDMRRVRLAGSAIMGANLGQTRTVGSEKGEILILLHISG